MACLDTFTAAAVGASAGAVAGADVTFQPKGSF